MTQKLLYSFNTLISVIHPTKLCSNRPRVHSYLTILILICPFLVTPVASDGLRVHNGQIQVWTGREYQSKLRSLPVSFSLSASSSKYSSFSDIFSLFPRTFIHTIESSFQFFKTVFKDYSRLVI